MTLEDRINPWLKTPFDEETQAKKDLKDLFQNSESFEKLIKES